MFVSLELLQALRDPALQGLAPHLIQAQRQRQLLLLSVTFLHGSVHSMIKFFFSQHIDIPKLPELEPDPRTARGEAGITVEKAYFGFLLELLWKRGDEKKERRLWYVQDILARFGTTTKILAPDSIAKVQASFQKGVLWTPTGIELDNLPSTVNNDIHVRYRGGGVSVLVEPEEEGGQLDERFVVMARGCGGRGVGLGLVYNNS
ncbi:hypothetical protein DFH09DRAFT_137123 [Mycena vulgaris]|nr:hypothetical protein DFH09DRAFT_137123 [Mycena vulgaris]